MEGRGSEGAALAQLGLEHNVRVAPAYLGEQQRARCVEYQLWLKRERRGRTGKHIPMNTVVASERVSE
jgi:hypothetical protein